MQIYAAKSLSFKYGEATCEHSLFETITENLLIRPYRPEDFESSATLYGDARLMKYFGHGAALSRQEVEARIETKCNLFKKGLPFGLFSIIHRKTEKFVGHLECLPHENNPATLALAIILNRAYHGTGFAHEAGHAFIYEFLIKCGHQFGKEMIQQVTATVHPKNRSSIKLIEENGLSFKENTIRFGQPRAVYLLTFPD